MVLTLSPQRKQPAQNLFCCSGDDACEVGSGERPAISMQVRESFAANFAADFCAAMTEHWHENDDKGTHAA